MDIKFLFERESTTDCLLPTAEFRSDWIPSGQCGLLAYCQRSVCSLFCAKAYALTISISVGTGLLGRKNFLTTLLLGYWNVNHLPLGVGFSITVSL